MNPKPHILLAMLDWGNGHLTRCIPIIRYLLQKNTTLSIACTPEQKSILLRENITAHFVSINSYNIRYTSSGAGFFLKMAIQLPRIANAIFKEHQTIKRFCSNNTVDIIISDNRFGFRHKDIFSVFITHQIYIKAGLFSFLANYINHYYILLSPSQLYSLSGL